MTGADIGNGYTDDDPVAKVPVKFAGMLVDPNPYGAGVFDQLETEARAAYDRILGLDLSNVSIDGSLHKAPCGGEGTGKNPLTGPNSAGNGHLQSTPTASRSAGPSTEPTATTSQCSNPPSPPSPNAAYSPSSSSAGYSTTETDGAPHHALPAKPLNRALQRLSHDLLRQRQPATRSRCESTGVRSVAKSRARWRVSAQPSAKLDCGRHWSAPCWRTLLDAR